MRTRLKQRTAGFRILFVAMLSFCVAVAAAQGAQAKSISKRIELVAGKAATVDLGQTVSDVLVANPSVVDVGTLRSTRLYLVGKTIGDTNVLAFDDNGNPLADIGVHVKVDQESLSSAFKEFFPGEKVDVRTINNNVVLSGTASSPLVANRVRDMASRFLTQPNQTVVDLMSVRGEQQVMLKVKVMEARRSVLREYGIDTDYKPGSTGGGVSTNGSMGFTSLQPFATGSILFDDNNKFGPLRISLQALERDGLVNTLAEPNLTAISGETAGFLAGGEFPVPVGTTDNGNTVTLEFKQFGVSLNFTPTVLTADNISLHLATEVSALADDLGLSLSGVDVPGLSVRRAETTVEISSGGSIIIAGLIQSGTTDNFNSVPGLGKLPILGELFKSKSFQRDESELIIMVTPYLVKPFAEPQAQMAGLAAPTPSPLPPALKPAIDQTGIEGLQPALRDNPEARPIRKPVGSNTNMNANMGEERTQGMNVPVIQEKVIQENRSSAVKAEAVPNFAPSAPIKTDPLPQQQTRVQQNVLMPDEKLAMTQALPGSKPATAAKTVAVRQPAAAGGTSESGLSRQFMRNLRATYGAKAPTATETDAPFGYLVD